MHGGVNGTVTDAVQAVRHAVDIDAETDGLLPTLFEQMMLAVTDLCAGIEVGVGEQLPDFLTGYFAAVAIGMTLDDAGKFHLQAARHDYAVVVFHDVGDAAFAGLAVHPDDGIVTAAHIGRVDRQVGHCPGRIRLLRGKPLFDGILVGA